MTTRRVSLWAPPLCYAALIFYLSSQSAPLPPLVPVVWDKALHAMEYAGLALLLCRALRGETVSWWRSVVFALIVASVYAATDEGHQLLVAGRDADVRDWLAASVGAAIGPGVYAWVVTRIRERR